MRCPAGRWKSRRRWFGRVADASYRCACAQAATRVGPHSTDCRPQAWSATGASPISFGSHPIRFITRSGTLTGSGKYSNKPCVETGPSDAAGLDADLSIGRRQRAWGVILSGENIDGLLAIIERLEYRSE